MAIENTSLVKFGYAINKDASTASGFITFDSGKQAIYVGDGTTANLVTSSVKDATFENSVLTITKIDGNEYTLDFSDVASASGVSMNFKALDQRVKDTSTAAAANATAIADLSHDLNDLDAAYKLADSSIRTDFAAADTLLSNRIKAVEDAVGENGSVATQIENAIAALDSSKEAEDASKFVKVKVDIVDGKLSENGVVVSTTDIASAQALTAHTGNTTMHITADERTNWNNAKSAIDAFLKDADMTTDAVDTLKELQKYMTDDASAANALVNRVGANETAIATLNGDASTAGSVAKAVADAKSDVVGDASEGYNTLGKLEDKIQAEASARESADQALGQRIDAITDGTNAVISFGGQKGEITVRGEQSTDGAVNLSMNGKQLEASIVGLRSAAFTDVDDYATADQGAKADSAVQNVVEGETNGTIKVDGTAVAVHGLGSAAYTEASAYDPAGTGEAKANAVKQEVIGADGDAATDNTIYGAKKYASEVANAAATVTGVDDTPTQSNKGYVTIALELNTKNVAVKSVAVDTQAVATADASTDGLATAYDVKQYVDGKDAVMDGRMEAVEAQLKWVIL